VYGHKLREVYPVFTPSTISHEIVEIRLSLMASCATLGSHILQYIPRPHKSKTHPRLEAQPQEKAPASAICNITTSVWHLLHAFYALRLVRWHITHPTFFASCHDNFELNFEGSISPAFSESSILSSSDFIVRSPRWRFLEDLPPPSPIECPNP
jgi:hypothetical protein